MYESSFEATADTGFLASMGTGMLLLNLAIIVLVIVAEWKLFEKAGEEGWKCIVPFLNFYTMTKIAKLEVMWFILMFIPFINGIAAFYVWIKFVQVYGKSTGWAIVSLFFAPIMLPLLAFSDAEYVG